MKWKCTEKRSKKKKKIKTKNPSFFFFPPPPFLAPNKVSWRFLCIRLNFFFFIVILVPVASYQMTKIWMILCNLPFPHFHCHKRTSWPSLLNSKNDFHWSSLYKVLTTPSPPTTITIILTTNNCVGVVITIVINKINSVYLTAYCKYVLLQTWAAFKFPL